MPRRVVTDDTLPVFLHVLDHWSGKLTWDRYRQHMAIRLNIRSMAPMTVQGHREIAKAFAQAKERIKRADQESVQNYGGTLESLRKELQALKTERERDRANLQALQERFANLAGNLYMIDCLDLEQVRKAISTPLRDMSNKGSMHGE
ncbi:MAG: hypothetical protein EOM26_07685 [Alphaproteobacteria bacterium]|nr:hypothetical protein [Alphaproteobacteria bacterium]